MIDIIYLRNIVIKLFVIQEFQDTLTHIMSPMTSVVLLYS